MVDLSIRLNSTDQPALLKSAKLVDFEQNQWFGVLERNQFGKVQPIVPLKFRRPEVHASHKHPVLLLPSGPDKIWALQVHESEPDSNIALKFEL